MSKRRRNGNSDAVRTLFGAGLLGVLTACLLLVPLEDRTKAALATALGPTVGLLAFVIYRLWDRWDRG